MKIDHLVHCAWFETLWLQERHAAKTVGEMKQFVSHLPQMQQAKAALAVHTNIAELIKEHTGNFESFCACRAKRVLLFHPLRSPDCCSNVHFLFFFIFFSFSYFFFSFDLTLMTAVGGRPKPEACFLLERLRWTLLPKEHYSGSLSGRGSNTQPSSWEADTTAGLSPPPNVYYLMSLAIILNFLISDASHDGSHKPISLTRERWRRTT